MGVIPAAKSRTLILVAVITLTFALPLWGRGQPRDKTAADFIRERFPALKDRGLPPLISITDESIKRVLPKHELYVLGFRQHPVAQMAPRPLKQRNLFAVAKDGKVQHLTSTAALEEFFRNALVPITDSESAIAVTQAWLRLSEEFKQDGFFRFSIPADSLTCQKLGNGLKATGKAVVTQGGKGDIRVTLTFNDVGRLTEAEEKSTVKPGVRPICQATKLLDPDPIVRRMAEADILVMGRTAKDYLDEQRSRVSPELRDAIDRIWKRIIDEGW